MVALDYPPRLPCQTDRKSEGRVGRLCFRKCCELAVVINANPRFIGHAPECLLRVEIASKVHGLDCAADCVFNADSKLAKWSASEVAALGSGGNANILLFESGECNSFKESDFVGGGFWEGGGLEFAE